MVVTILNGEVIPVVQSRVYDAGFEDLDIVPLGVDKAFIHSMSNQDVMSVLTEAKDFFNLFFLNHIKWNKDMVAYEHGAWVRIYDTPLHACNASFFKLCVFDCGRFLRVDNCSIAKERFDYARILVATSSLEVIIFKFIY